MGERRGTKALELWCRRMTEGYPGVKIDNMTTSWRDGLAFCAMIHHFRPDLIEFDKLNKADVYYNNELAFTTAEKYLGIPALLDAVDMATYEVPDRLSILTYLSQFYQVFAAQDSPNRLKRPSPAASAEKTQITKAAGPPPKMAHVVGVPKRDPCQKCQLPVFLAERLLIGKKVYHRTCLKCARCGSQLTPGSFYETEVDGEYCCETCPDEEVQLNATGASSEDLAVGGVQLRQTSAEQTPTSSSRNAALPKNVRSSIAERLAFFEQTKKDAGAGAGAVGSSEAATSSKFLLQKSVSDEEKSKSLQRMEAPTTSTYKMNSALSSFLNDTIDGEGDDGESLTNTVESKSGNETQMETSDTENDTDAETSLEDVAPALPKTQPPNVTPPGSDTEKEKAQQNNADNRRFTATAQLQLATTSKDAQQTASIESAKNTATPSGSSTGTPIAKKRTHLELNLATTATAAPPQAHAEQQADNVNNNDQQKNLLKRNATDEPAQKAQTSLTTTNNLDLSEPNSNEDVTKDQNVDTNVIAATTAAKTTTSTTEKLETLRANLRELDTESGTENMDTSVEKPVEMRIKSLESPEDVATTERLSVVRARLQQFEAIANKRNNNANEEKQADNDTRNDNDTTLNTEDKLSEPETDNTNIDSDKKIMNADAEVANKTIAQVTTPPATPTSNAASATESLTKVNLEDEAKLRAMETEKADKIETKAREIQESLANEVPSETETAKDNNLVLDKVESEQKTLAAAPRIEISVVESSEDATMEDTLAKLDVSSTVDAPKALGDVFSKVNNTTTTIEKQLTTTPSKVSTEAYPEDLNPFKSEDEDGDDDDYVANKENLQKEQVTLRTPQPRGGASAVTKSAEKAQNLNPFDSSDDEIELEKSSSRNSTAASTPTGGKVPPPRPPPPRISRNPFGEEVDEEAAAQLSRRSSLSSSLTKKTPVPTPRTNLDYYGSANSLGSTPQSLQRNTDVRGSNNSLTSSAGGTMRSRKSRKAPAPPTPLAKELFPTVTPTPPPPSVSDRQTDSSKASTPSSSTVGTPKLGRKKRPAPAPPKPARLDPSLLPTDPPAAPAATQHTNGTAPKNSLNYPLQSETSDSKLSDEEKALLEGNKQLSIDSMRSTVGADDELCTSQESRRSSRRLIPLDASLLLDDDDDNLNADANADGDGSGKCDDAKQKQQLLRYSEKEETNVVYRRAIVPPSLETPTRESNPLLDSGSHDRQLEKMKDNKEAQNRNRQSQISASSGAEDCDITATPYNKSAHGKWKRRKGPAPALPIPPRKVLQMLPLQEIRHELDIIEVQQQGLEKQGVILEKMIRDRCEGQNGELLGANAAVEDAIDGKKPSTSGGAEGVQNSKEVEDLILQLFELVNEKNELFRRQAELMYLRRQHRLEQEQADLEYEIRVLMAQPERNKTDSDKAREETLIARLVEVVQLRNEVVECLEMDRLREAEEDLSIKQRLELHTAQREEDTDSRKITTKLSKKEKKKQKESKKLSKSKKIDADKDADESELNMDKQKLKKKKKKFLF
ncbi:PREDICTED: MICAL-like protein 1 isoform X2 [Bactrocera latifrons]|uniref:MICAL-like protein 1 isoform X2 n=1 Tax=Bactrocera latifrons TaxID=174628 RepID=UPI0008DD4E1A|nr:PREDICTED: MICAL-like protein 1 isoform X2 [Bactrocera latifrons]